MTEQIVQESYDQAFFEALRGGSQQSAAVIVPIILEYIHPQRVVDVGCGDGTWLSVFREHGVLDVLGIDGVYVDPDHLQVPKHQFMPWDLTQPIALDQKFDLAMSLEVAEHLPGESASNFVSSLVRLSDVVLFSAAIPHQGGTNHINEQWPSYWIQHFEAHGYIAIDALRAQIWNHSQVEPWYAQNSFIFVRGDRLFRYPKLQALHNLPNTIGPALVHPNIYLYRCPSTLSSTSDAGCDTPAVSHAIRILDVKLLPAEIQTGDPLTVEVTYQIDAPLDSAHFTISLSHENGTLYLDTNTLVHPLPEDRTVPHRLQLHLDRLDVVQGRYFINPGVFAADWGQAYDFHWHQYPLTVQATVPQNALLHPPMHWHYLTDKS